MHHFLSLFILSGRFASFWINFMRFFIHNECLYKIHGKSFIEFPSRFSQWKLKKFDFNKKWKLSLWIFALFKAAFPQWNFIFLCRLSSLCSLFFKWKVYIINPWRFSFSLTSLVFLKTDPLWKISFIPLIFNQTSNWTDFITFD